MTRLGCPQKKYAQKFLLTVCRPSVETCVERAVLFLVCVICSSPGLGYGQSECTLPVSAYLADSAGVPLDGALAVELRFYLDGAPDSLPVECRTA